MYGPHFVEPFAPPIDLGERKNPFSVPSVRGVLFSVEPLSDARTPLGKSRVLARRGWMGENGDFFSILLIQKFSIDNSRHRKEQDRRRKHHPSNQCKRALENIPLWITVEKGQQDQHNSKSAW